MGVMELRRNILLNEPHVSTAVGNPVAFNTDVKGLLQQARFDFLPVQSGSGDPSPSNVRPISGWTGVGVWHDGGNIIDSSQLTDNKVWWNGALVDGYSRNCATPKIPVKEGATYYRQGSTENQNAVSFFDKNGDFVSQVVWQPNVAQTIPSGVYFMGLSFGKNYKAEAMVSYGSTATLYVPYARQQYPVTFPAVGRNLLDPANRIASGNNVQYYRSGDKFLLKGGQAYTLSANVTTSQLTIFDSNNTAIVRTTNQTLTYAPTEDVNVWFDIYVANSQLPDGGISAVYGQLELGDTAHSYEPYTNTVYGGHIDLVTGELWGTWGKVVFDGTEGGWGISTSSGLQRAAIGNTDENFIVPPKYGGALYADYLKNSSESNEWNGWLSKTTGNFLCYISSEITTRQLWQAYLAEHPLTVVYEFSTPILLATLTPQQISALTGNNTIWADTNGDATIKFWSH